MGLSAPDEQLGPASEAHRDVTVCICTRNRPDDLAVTLASIQDSTVPVAQVIVSDDGHDPRTEAVCRAAPVPVEYVLGPQEGLGANRNRALEHSTGDAVLFVDDDCLLMPDYLETALACMRDAEARHGHGRVIVSGAEWNRGQLVLAHEQTFLGFQARPYRDGEALRSIVVNATLFPATLFGEMRFDPQLFYGGDEVDIASRASSRGFSIVNCPEAANDHRPSPSDRDDYDVYRDACRVYMTFSRYLFTDRVLWKAAAFGVVAPLHVLAAGARRARLEGVKASAGTLKLAAAMLVRRVRTRT